MGPVYELMAVLGLDKKPFEEGLNDAGKEAEKGGSGIGKALGTAAKVGAAAITAATTAAVAFGASAVNAGKEFDTSMSQVYATMGNVDSMGEDGFNKLKQAASEMGIAFDDATTATELSREVLRQFAQEQGASTAFSATQAADALNYMALAGYDATTSMEMLPNVLNLAASGNMDLARASDMVTDAQSALGLTLPETTVMVDQMAKASSTTNTSVEQLGDAILTIGATARSVKGGTAELSTVLGILADNGIKGSEGGTHLRNAILSLQTPTKDGTEALKKLGLTYGDMYDSAGNLRSLPDIFQQLSSRMEGMTQQSKDAIISGIFNKTDLAAINALVGTDAERWDEVAQKIGEAEGAAKAMAGTQLDNLAGDITLFRSALEGAQIAVSDVLTPSLREFVQFGTEGISVLTQAFQKDGLSGAIEALDGIISRGIEMLFEVIPEATSAGLALLQAIISGILENLPSLINAAIQIVTTLVQDITTNLPKLLDAAVEIIFALADGLIDALPQLIPAIVEIVLTLVEKLTEPTTLMRLIGAAIQIIGAVALGLIEAIPKIVETVPTIIMNLVEAIIRFLPQLMTSGIRLMTELALGVAKGAAEVIAEITKLLSDIPKRFMERITDAKNWGKDLISNFTNGIKEKWNSLKDTLRATADAIRSFLGFSEPEEGPLSNFHTYAPDMMELFAKGIRDNEDMLKNTVSDAFDFGSMTVNSVERRSGDHATEVPSTPFIVQCVLNERVIGEATFRYNARLQRVTG